MLNNDMEQGTAQPPVEVASDWVKETRARASASEVPEPTPARVSPWSRRLRFGLYGGALLVLSWCFWVWGQDAFRATSGVRGKLRDRAGRPVVAAPGCF